MSIRLRLALAFTLATAALFTIGALVFVSTLSSALLGSIDDQLAADLGLAGRYVGHTGASGSATPTPTGSDGSSGEGTTRAAVLPGEYVVQMLDASGRVRGASGDARDTALLSASDRRTASRTRLVVTRSVDGQPTRVAAEPYAGRHGWVAVAAVPLDSYDHTVRDLETGLVIGGVLVVVAAALGSYALARAALSPVERMRREVAALARRADAAEVPVPRTHDELAALAVTMNQLLGRLRGALERQRAFVADASHELRTPFAVLRGELELAGRPGRSGAELRTAIAHAAEEAARLTRLTDDLLVLARSDSDELTVRRENVDVAALLGESVEAARTRASEVGVELQVQSPRPLWCWVDAVRVRQAVDNLIDNALRFAPRGSAVSVRALLTGPSLVVEVSDRGPGFPTEFLPHAFERFARPDTARARDDGGAGLGLAIVRAIAHAHGGNAGAANRDGGGATVHLELPLGGPEPEPGTPLAARGGVCG